MSPELKEKVERLCEVLTKATHERWEHTKDKTSFDYSVGQKYIRIISCEHGQHRSVWGFINKKEWRKGQTGITFKEGDMLQGTSFAKLFALTTNYLCVLPLRGEVREAWLARESRTPSVAVQSCSANAASVAKLWAELKQQSS